MADGVWQLLGNKKNNYDNKVHLLYNQAAWKFSAFIHCVKIKEVFDVKNFVICKRA